MTVRRPGETMAAGPYTLITGASSGIGREIAVNLSRDRRLLLCARRRPELEETRGRCERPDDHRVLPLDLAEPGRIEAELGGWLTAEQAAVDTLVYCAGVFRPGPLRTFAPAEITSTMTVNFISAAELCRLLLKRALNGAHLQSVVFISSVAAIRGARGYAVYSASKGALDAFARSLALEVAPAVRVNTVQPGAVMTDHSDATLLEGARANHPLGVGKPEDVAGAVRYLLSPEARWITGQSLVVDGGFSCR